MMLRKKKAAPPEIPTASMADVAFLLIIFFLVTTNFIKEKGIKLELPNTEKSQETADQKKKNTEVRITKTSFLLNDTEIKDEELADKINELLKDANSEADRIVIVKSDKGASYERFVLANDALQKTPAIITIEVTEGGDASHVKKEEIKKVNVKGEIEAKMKEAEYDGEEPPEDMEKVE